MKIGSRVRIVEDEFEELVGRTGTVGQVSSDGTAVWVDSDVYAGVWCAVCNLEEI